MGLLFLAERPVFFFFLGVLPILFLSPFLSPFARNPNGVGFLILTLAEITVRYSGMSWNYTAIYFLIPAGMIPLFYFTLIRKFKYENLLKQS